MFNVVFTDEGRALIAEIASDIDYSLLISDVKYSEHDYTGQEASVTEATFTGDFASGTKSISVVDSTTMRIETYFNNQYINEQKDLYTIGIFAKCVKPNGMIYTEIDSGLLAVCTVSTPRIIPPYADAPFSVFSYNINLAVGSADNVTVVETQAGVQYKELTTPITINGTQETTVEGALSGLNDYGDALADNLAANENVYGAKNLIPFPYEDGMSNTFRGVTYTVSDRGIISTANTATNDGWFVLATNIILVPGIYKIEGCPSGGSIGTYILTARVARSGGAVDNYYDVGGGQTFAFNAGDSLNVTINVINGTDMDGLTFYPMLYDARILDPTYAPPAETNLQLTRSKAERNDLSTIHATGSTNTTGVTITNGTFFYLNGQFCKATANIAVNATFTLNTNFEVTTVGGEVSKIVQTDDFGHGITKVFSAKRGCLIIISRQSDGIFFIGHLDTTDTVSSIVSVNMSLITLTYSAGTISINNQSGTTITATVIGG